MERRLREAGGYIPANGEGTEGGGYIPANGEGTEGGRRLHTCKWRGD